MTQPEQYLCKTKYKHTSGQSPNLDYLKWPKGKLSGQGGIYDPRDFLLDTCHPAVKKDDTWFLLGPEGCSLCKRSADRQQEALTRYSETIAHKTLPSIFFEGRELTYHVALYAILNRLPPLSSNCRAVMTVPIYNEESLIGGFLDTVKKQCGLEPGELEVSFIINGPEGYSQDRSSQMCAQAVSAYKERGIDLTRFVPIQGS